LAASSVRRSAENSICMVPRARRSLMRGVFQFFRFAGELCFCHALTRHERADGSSGTDQRLAALQGARRRPIHFSSDVSETPRIISTMTGTNVLSMAKTLAYLVIMKPRPEMVV